MSYQPINWKDRIVERPNTFETVSNDDNTLTLIPAPGQVLQEGTPLNAENLNYIEKGLLDVNASLAEKVPNPSKHLHVGKNPYFAYLTVNNAINASKDNDTIFVHQGEYKEVIKLTEKKLTLIGDDKNNTIIRDDSGLYVNSPLLINGGNLKFKNITFLATHDDVVSNVEANGSYGVHVDRSETEGTTYNPSKIEFENCIMISHQNSAFGCGTENDQHIILNKCDLYTYTDVANGSSENSLKNGALLYHTSLVNYDNQKLSLINCNIYGKNSYAMRYRNITPNFSGSELEVVNCNFYSEVYDGSKSVLIENTLLLSKNSYGNNFLKFNYEKIGQLKALTNEYGECRLITDCNATDALYGYFKVNGTNGNSNTPTNAWYLGLTIPYSLYGTVSYIVQYVWNITGNNECYKRKLSTGSNWTTWERCYESETEIKSIVQGHKITQNNGYAIAVTSVNDLKISGWFSCNIPTTVGLPTQSQYLIESIFFNASFGIHYAYDVLNGFKKYKRTCSSGVWSSWVEVN